jgi:hypothetical protein
MQSWCSRKKGKRLTARIHTDARWAEQHVRQTGSLSCPGMFFQRISECHRPSGVARGGIGIAASCERRQTDADWLAQNKPGDGSDRTPAEASRPVVLTPAGVPCRAGAVWARRGLVVSVEKTMVDRWRLGRHGRAAGASGTRRICREIRRVVTWAGTATDNLTYTYACNVSQLSLLESSALWLLVPHPSTDSSGK